MLSCTSQPSQVVYSTLQNGIRVERYSNVYAVTRLGYQVFALTSLKTRQHHVGLLSRIWYVYGANAPCTQVLGFKVCTRISMRRPDNIRKAYIHTPNLSAPIVMRLRVTIYNEYCSTNIVLIFKYYLKRVIVFLVCVINRTHLMTQCWWADETGSQQHKIHVKLSTVFELRYEWIFWWEKIANSEYEGWVMLINLIVAFVWNILSFM